MRAAVKPITDLVLGGDHPVGELARDFVCEIDSTLRIPKHAKHRVVRSLVLEDDPHRSTSSQSIK